MSVRLIMNTPKLGVNGSDLMRSDKQHDVKNCNISVLNFSGIKYLLEKCPNFSGPLQKALIQVFQEEYGDSRDQPDLPMPVLIFILSIFMVMILFGTLGSALVILVVARKPSMRSRSNMFIMNLAISDLTLCLFTEPFNLFQIWATNRPWNLGSLMCKLLAMFQGTNIFVSTISITAIALDRFQCIIYPTVPHRRSNNVATLLILVWIAAFILASPLAFFSHVDEVKVLRCTERTFNRLTQQLKVSYYVAALFFQYVVPLLTVSIVYWRICVRIRNRFLRTANKGGCAIQLNDGKPHRRPSPRRPEENVPRDVTHSCHRRGSMHNITDSRQSPHSVIHRPRDEQLQTAQLTVTRATRMHREKKPIVLLSAIAIIFGLSWLPLNISNVYMEFKEMMIAKHFQLPSMMTWNNVTSNVSNQINPLKEQSLIGPENVLIFQTFCLFLVLNSACFNPIIYGWLNDNFRAEFCNFFRANFCRRNGLICFLKQQTESSQSHMKPITRPEANSCPVHWVTSPPFYSSCKFDGSLSSVEIEHKVATRFARSLRADSNVIPISVEDDPQWMKENPGQDPTKPTEYLSSCGTVIPERQLFAANENDQLEIERINQSLLKALSENDDSQDTIPEVDSKPDQQNWCSVITAV